jgi:hypothetical protein
VPGIEFLPDGVGSDARAELRPPGPTRPHRLMIGAVLVLVAAAVVVAASRRATPYRPASRIDTYSGVGLRHVVSGAGADAPVLAVAVTGATTWVLEADGLHIVGATGSDVRRRVPARGWTSAQLVADPAGRVVWLVGNGLAYAYSTRTRELVDASTAPDFRSAAALHGRLFLAADRTVVELGGANAGPRPVFTAPAELTSVAADPLRNRLLIADAASPTHVWAVVPGDAGPGRVVRETTIRSVRPSLVVTAGRIWMAGVDTGDGVLMRLHPDTLRPVSPRRLGSGLEPGAVIAGAGESAVWVRAAKPDGEVRCDDADTGRQLQSWLLTGPVASTGGRAVIGTAHGALELDLHLCGG